MTTSTMAEQLVPDEVWAAIQPLLPARRPHPKGGRPWIEDHAVLGGIIYVLRAGVWEQLHHRLLDWLGDDGQVDWSRAVIGTRGRPGRPRWRPAKLHADKGDDFPSCRQALRRRKISPRIARRGVESSQRLGRHRWKVERSLGWLS